MVPRVWHVAQHGRAPAWVAPRLRDAGSSPAVSATLCSSADRAPASEAGCVGSIPAGETARVVKATTSPHCGQVRHPAKSSPAGKHGHSSDQ